MEEKVKGKYTKSADYEERRQELVKRFSNKINTTYFESFKSVISESSSIQYRSAIIRLESHLNGKDLMTATVDDIKSYLLTHDKIKTREVQQRFIQSFLRHIFTIDDFIEQATIKADSNTILSMMDDTTKKLMQILMNK